MIGLAMMLAAAEPSFMKTGNDFIRECPEKYGRVCMAYVWGVVNGLSVQERATHTSSLCARAGVTMGQYYDVVQKALDDHPESRDGNLFIITANALVKAFPCPKPRG